MATIWFGALVDPIQIQLTAQGYELSAKDNGRLQHIADSIVMLAVHGYIPDTVVARARKKLMREISMRAVEHE